MTWLHGTTSSVSYCHNNLSVISDELEPIVACYPEPIIINSSSMYTMSNFLANLFARWSIEYEWWEGKRTRITNNSQYVKKKDKNDLELDKWNGVIKNHKLHVNYIPDHIKEG